MTLPDPYHARRSRKVRRINAVGFSLLAVLAVAMALTWASNFTTPHRSPDHEYLANLPYPAPPVPHPDQPALLLFTSHTEPAGTSITTQWLPLALAVPDTDGDPRPGSVYFRFETFFEGPARVHPTDHVLLHLAATGAARLPVDPDTAVVFNAGRTITLTTNAQMLADAAAFHAPPPPLHDPMLYLIHPDAILDLLNHPETSPPLTMTLGPYTAQLTDLHLTPLQALAATLKPGYTPPPNEP
jgi:hypothetical protein